jgi:hypothetical protein
VPRLIAEFSKSMAQRRRGPVTTADEAAGLTSDYFQGRLARQLERAANGFWIFNDWLESACSVALVLGTLWRESETGATEATQGSP